MILEIFPLLLVITLIIFIVLYRQSLGPTRVEPVLEQDHGEDQHHENKKKMGKKKLKHLERKEQEKQYREYIESLKQDQILREELKAEAREKLNAKSLKQRKKQEEVEVEQLQKRIQARALEEQRKRDQEKEELCRISNLTSDIKNYIKKKKCVTLYDLQLIFSIDGNLIDDKLMDDIKLEMQLVQIEDVYIYLDDKEQLYEYILERGVVDQVDILDFFFGV